MYINNEWFVLRSTKIKRKKYTKKNMLFIYNANRMGTAENDSTRAQACKQNHETNVTKTVAVDIMLLPPSNKM